MDKAARRPEREWDSVKKRIQRGFRLLRNDLHALRYAILVIGIYYLAVHFLFGQFCPHDDCFAPSLSGLRDDPGSLAGLVREVGEGLEPAASGIWMDRPGELVWSPPLSIGPDRAFQMDAGLPGADSAGDAGIVLLEGGSRLSRGA